jgi:hypothetical protein
MNAESPYSTYNFNMARTAHILQEILGQPGVFAQGAVGSHTSGSDILKAMLIGEVNQHLFMDVMIAQDLVVYSTPTARGGVWVKQLADNFYAWARENKADVVKIDVDAGINNDRAIPFFNKIGFEVSGACMMRAV